MLLNDFDQNFRKAAMLVISGNSSKTMLVLLWLLYKYSFRNCLKLNVNGLLMSFLYHEHMIALLTYTVPCFKY